MEQPSQLNITQSELAPRVADYFDTLLTQRDAILERYGLTPETAGTFCDVHSTDEDRETILALYERMVYVIENKQIPHGEKFLYTFVVPDALNPYADALRKAGLPDDHPLCLEKKEMTLDIREIIAFQTKHYRKQGRESWADDIEQHIDQLYEHLASLEEKERIELRIKAGYIPVAMPGRNVQLADWEEALHDLKPIYYKYGLWIDIHKPYIDQNAFSTMVDSIRDPHNSFFQSIPERPYLIWTKPLAECSAETDPVWQTTKLTFEQQEKQLETLHEHHSALCDELDITPLEYAALQSLFTETIRHMMDECNIDIDDIIPLDAIGYTRFIVSCLLTGDGVYGACFFRKDLMLGFGVGRMGVPEGFRPAARS